MNPPKNPHVSEAIVQLRRWVTLSGLVLGIAAGAQLLIFGFVHYTDVRLQELKPTTSGTSDLSVVASDGEIGVRTSAQSMRSGHALTDEQLAAAKAAMRDVNLVATPAGVVMENASGLVSAVGCVAAAVLLAMTLLGVCVAGGGQVPGVGKVVSAFGWSIVVISISLPWSSVLPVMPLQGIFGTYDALIAQSEVSSGAGAAGGQLLLKYVLMPLTAIAASAFVVFSFKNGVESGVIIRSVSELDEAVDKEIAHLRDRGVSSSAPRAVGALNRAMGDDVHPVAARSTPDTPRRIGQPHKGDGMGRPI